jgi:hypothetical protein
MARKNTEIVTLSLRIREELRKRVEREAKRADRSMNAEIIHRLEQSFEHEDIIKAVREAVDSNLTPLTDRIDQAFFSAGFRDGGGSEKELKRALKELSIDPDKSEREDKS